LLPEWKAEEMVTFILVLQVLVALGMIGLILLQQSEGGASGFVSGQMTGMMSSRGAANFLTKGTAILAACFFGLSLLLAVLAKRESAPQSIIGPAAVEQQAPATTEPEVPSVPAPVSKNEAPTETPAPQVESSPVDNANEAPIASDTTNEAPASSEQN
jgi:preprotein translocase subunit SecG